MKTKKTKLNLEEKNVLIKDYIKTNFWKRLFKYKIIELGVIPTIALMIYGIPMLIGYGIVKLFNITPVDLCEIAAVVSCDSSKYDISQIYALGFLTCLLIGVFIGINIHYVLTKLKKEACNKYEVRWWEI